MTTTRTRKWPGRARTAATAFVLSGVLALSACADRGESITDPPPSDGTATSVGDPALQPGLFPTEGGGQPVKGGTLTFSDQGEARSLDPTVTISVGALGGNATLAVYDALVRYDVETGEFLPQLAESVEPNDDYTVWTVKLREGVNFTDGTPLNADAVIGSVNYFAENGGYDFMLIGPVWEGIEKVDDLTVEFRLSTPWTTFSTMLARGPGMIVAPAAYAEGKENFTPIGAGPFMFESYSPQEELVLTANPDYWDGAPHLDKLRFVWLGADETSVDALRGGQIHGTYLRSSPLIKELREDNQPGYIGVHNLGHMVKVNSSEGRPGEDERVRNAMALAIDPQVVFDRAYEGAGLPSKLMLSPISRWHSDVEPTPTDPEAATALLEEAKADGFDGKVEILTASDPVGRDSALAVQAMLEAVGFEVTVDVSRTTADTIQRVYIEKNYDITVGGDALLDEDPYVSLAFTLHGKSLSNSIGFDNEEMNALIDELRGTPAEERGDLLAQIEEKFQETMPSIPLAPATPYMVWGKNVHGINPSHEQMLDFSEAWIVN